MVGRTSCGSCILLLVFVLVLALLLHALGSAFLLLSASVTA
jgi:hypothetical protein